MKEQEEEEEQELKEEEEEEESLVNGSGPLRRRFSQCGTVKDEFEFCLFLRIN